MSVRDIAVIQTRGRESVIMNLYNNSIRNDIAPSGVFGTIMEVSLPDGTVSICRFNLLDRAATFNCPICTFTGESEDISISITSISDHMARHYVENFRMQNKLHTIPVQMSSKLAADAHDTTLPKLASLNINERSPIKTNEDRVPDEDFRDTNMQPKHTRSDVLRQHEFLHCEDTNLNQTHSTIIYDSLGSANFGHKLDSEHKYPVIGLTEEEMIQIAVSESQAEDDKTSHIGSVFTTPSVSVIDTNPIGLENNIESAKPSVEFTPAAVIVYPQRKLKTTEMRTRDIFAENGFD